MSDSVSLSPGSRLGRYEIASLLGTGGMGEVYRAHDPHLKRDVALKVVRRTAATADQLERFTREARAASSLNHPNIVAVYDAGVEAGTPFVVTELLEGETLRARLDRGPIPFRKAVEYAIQIAHALDAAHAGRIWHRDVKPANAFILNDGRVKLLDFGIAKLAERAWHSEADDPTSNLSESREVLGTAGYMSPEQVLGQPIDHRTDIFALGAVLYEMFTRTRAFKRSSSVETMHAVLHDDPVDPLTLSPTLPPMAVAIVRRCLEKNKEERFQSARDLAFDLQQLDSTKAEKPLPAPLPIRWQPVVRAAIAAALLAAGATLGYLLVRPPVPPHFEQLTFRRARIGGARFVADGRSVVYSEAREGHQLELSRIDLAESPPARPLGYDAGTEIFASRAGEIALSVDRRFLMGERFVGALAIAPLGSGAPRRLEENIEDADWDPQGKALAVVRSTGGMGGSSELEYPIGTKRYAATGSIRFPRISRDGRRIAFQEDNIGGGEGGDVLLLDLETNTVKELAKDWKSLRGLAWSPDGREVWFTAGDSRTSRVLRAVTPDGEQRIVMGAPGSLTLWDVTADGRALVSRDDERRSLVGMAPGDTAERELSWFDDSGLADVSNDGRSILFSDRFGIYLGGTDGSQPMQLGLTNVYGDDLSPDARMVLATRLAGNELLMLASRGGQPQPLPAHNIVSYSGARWFGDGRRILFSGREHGRGLRSYIQSVNGSPPAALTPEGIWGLSLALDDSAVAAIGGTQPGISIWPMNGGPSRMVPNSQSGDRPVSWTSDGKALWIFRRGEMPAQIYKLDIATGRRDPARLLKPSDLAGVYSITEFAITPDGHAYFYSYRRLLSQLYLVTGIK